VLIGRPRVLGLLLLLGSTTACSGAQTQPSVERTDVAVQSYAPPAGAPGYCTLLAGSPHLVGLPVAIGTLTARPGDVEAKLALSAAVGDLRAVGEEVARDDGTAALGAALDELTAALARAEAGPLTDAVRTAVSTGLDDVGLLVQPACDFPT
jgi:hypothetical protein